ncbi:hypothetical protein B0H14DRAFT_3694735 [Mycena olivaceomarginata]|nr:hypothetical protein B0H14DRAFT_3694735 [Mycena olivaceomarginata]
MAEWAVVNSPIPVSITTKDQILRLSLHIIPAETVLQLPPEPFTNEDFPLRAFIRARRHALHTNRVHRALVSAWEIAFQSSANHLHDWYFLACSDSPPCGPNVLCHCGQKYFDMSDSSECILLELIRLPLLDAYVPGHESTSWQHRVFPTYAVPWLDDIGSRIILKKNTFSIYLNNSHTTNPDVVDRLQALVNWLGEMDQSPVPLENPEARHPRSLSSSSVSRSGNHDSRITFFPDKAPPELPADGE